jgi:carbonic anhydrase
VVCGHTECGGIKALESPPSTSTEPHIASWLELAQPARERILTSDVPEPEHYLETIKLNVLMQCDNLRTYPCVAEREQTGCLSIHPWLYDLHTGEIQEYDEDSTRWAAVAEQRT